ncbi:MAG: hypothetical protein IPK04_07920 [Bdellovibrionales bacterium]|nr:hypothetical protein [Bdellovibrionales bacterium]
MAEIVFANDQIQQGEFMKMFASAIVALFATVALANPPAAPTAAATPAPTAPAVTAPAAATGTTAKAEKCAKDDKKCMDKKEAAKKTH